MAKESGMGMTVTVEDVTPTARDISNDITSISFGTPRGVQDVTGLDVSAMERILLLADGTVSISGVFNDASNMSHDVFKNVPKADNVSRAVVITVSAKTLTMEILFADYALSRGADGSMTWTATGNLADGVAPVWA